MPSDIRANDFTALALFALGLLSVVLGARAQNAGAPSFEVASIKANRNPDAAQNARVLAGGRIEVTNMPLRALVRIAFGVTGPQVAGGPGWVGTDGFDIVAKAEGLSDSDQTGQLRAMLKALLVERFQLRVHSESREADAYALVLANGAGTFGPALKRSQADCSQANACGIRGGNGDITYAGVDMSQIATSLAGQAVIRRPVADRTGLSGAYDLHLRYSPAGEPSDVSPSIFTALVEQAGLRLEPIKTTLDVIVIDHVERPRED